MKNFINIRLETNNRTKTKNDLKHNLRVVNSLSKENDNKNFYYDKDANEKNNLELYKIVKNNEIKLEKELDKLVFERTKRHLRNNKTHLINGVITFSEEQRENFKNNVLDIKKIKENTLETLKDICKKYKTEILYFVLHLDEKTPHVHFHLKNFDDQGFSIFQKIKTKENLSNLQDIAFENFKNMNIQRGIKKDEKLNKYDHISIKKFHEEERRKIREEIKQLREVYKNEKIKIRKEKKELLEDKKNSNMKKLEEINKRLNDMNNTTIERKTNKDKVHELNDKLKEIYKDEKTKVNELHEKLKKLQKIEINKDEKIRKKGINHEFRNR